jgi:hypothetical protein
LVEISKLYWLRGTVVCLLVGLGLVHLLEVGGDEGVLTVVVEDGALEVVEVVL